MLGRLIKNQLGPVCPTIQPPTPLPHSHCVGNLKMSSATSLVSIQPTYIRVSPPIQSRAGKSDKLVTPPVETKTARWRKR